MNSATIGALIAGAIGLVLLIGIGVVLLYPPVPDDAPNSLDPITRELVIIGGEIEGAFGFALEGKELSSPASPIVVKVGDVLRITYKNVGKIPHSFAVHLEPDRAAPAIFGAAVGSATRPILPDQEGSIIFTADRAGSFSYLCTVPGHIELGMFGNFVVED